MFRLLNIAHIDRRVILRFDWLLFSLALIIAVIGIINIYSAGSSVGISTTMFRKQIYWLAIGLFFLFLGAFLNYSYIEQYCLPLYAFSVFLLVLVLIHGKVVSGSQRWFSFAGLNFQPSELIKISLIMLLAKWFKQNHHPRGYDLPSLCTPFLLVFVPFLLVFLQPDLGSAIMLLLVFFGIVLFAKIRLRSFLALLVVFLGILPFSWSLLKDYQKDRIVGFLDPHSDPLGKGYQIIQSKIAIGSGRYFGKGFLKGTQTQLNFIPEKYTDFVFSVFCEEWGFFGAMVLLCLYFLLFMRLLFIVNNAKNSFGMILGWGITTLLFMQFLINVGMVLGLVPTVGIPLPLFSYGGSSLAVSLFSVGILINIHIQRYMF